MPFGSWAPFGNYGTANSEAGLVYVWDGSAGDGLWSTAANWDLAAVPGSGDTAIITSTADDIDYDVSGKSVQYLRIGQGYTGNLSASVQVGRIAGLHINQRTGSVAMNMAQCEKVYIYRTAGSATAVDLTGSIGTITMLRGSLTISGASTTVDAINLVSPRGRTVRVDINATTNTGTIRAHAGSFIDTTAGHSEVDIWGRSSITTTGTLATGTLTMEDETLIEWQSENDIETEAIMYGGTIRLKGNHTQGVSIDGAQLYGSSILDLRTGTDGAMGFASPNPLMYGGRIITDEGRTLTVT